MTSQDFEVLLHNRLNDIKNVLGNKSKEYSSTTDRLHNFKVAARLDDEIPERALWGMLKKHLVSVMDIKNTCDTKAYSTEMIDEKIGDSINYLILLEALLKERYQRGVQYGYDSNKTGD